MKALTDFCNQILCSESLNDKLEICESLDFDTLQPLKNIPDLPARSAELSFNYRPPVVLPSVNDLEDEKQRGILLHFFLNHELLALELMALILLRFPEAPVSFRKGLVKTMKDEQQHATLYLKLMRQFGVEAGDVPMNKFFWDALAKSDTLQKFVAGMSLTFEQANLDFSLYFKKAFETIGDLATAEVLQKVYDDEITHVCHGLSWFRRWKQKGISDWQEYAKILEIPLSPSRGKGPLFDVQGRRQAGFDDEFINQMKVTSMSRGRSPDVFIFHGFTEVSIAEGSSFNFPKWGRVLEQEMSLLPLVFCRQDDLLLSWGDVSVEHLQKLQASGLTVPEVVTCHFDEAVKPLHKRHAGSLRPWGWSPYIHHKLQPLLKQNEKLSGWQASYKNLFSKSFAVDLARLLKAENAHIWLAECDVETELCNNFAEVKEAVERFIEEGWKSVVIKAPLGASGRSMRRILDGEITEVQHSQIIALFKNSDELLVEPWVERALDFSLHFDISEEVKFKGVTRLLNDERGQYSGSLFGNPWREVDKDCLKILHSATKRGINGFGDWLAKYLSEKLKACAYRGPLGIDCFIYKNREGELKVRPIVEMNFRHTMGRVALGFEKFLKPGRTGRLSILSLKSKRQKYLRGRMENLSQEIPDLTDNGMWNKGVLMLNEYSEKLNFPILVAVGNNGQECEELVFGQEPPVKAGGS